MLSKENKNKKLERLANKHMAQYRAEFIAFNMNR